MSSKALNAKVRLDTSQAEAALNRLTAKITALNRAVANAGKLNTGVERTVAQYDKLAVQQQRLALQEQRLALQREKFKSSEAAQLLRLEQMEQNRLARQQAAVDRVLQREMDALHKKQQATWAAFQKEQQLYDRQIAKERQIREQAERINQAWRKTHPLLTKIGDALGVNKSKTASWGNSVESLVTKLNDKLKGSNAILGSIGRRLAGIAATYFGIMGARTVMDTTDVLVGAQNRLNYVSAGQLGDAGYNSDGSYSAATLNATQDALDKMYVSSQKVRTSYQDMIANVSKTMSLAGDAFNNNTDYAIRFQEIMAEAYAVGGASAKEMSSSMYQLTQALGSGVLQGDELRSVREGAPLAYQAIEQFAQGVYGADKSLKDMASQGMITSQMVVAAIMNAGSELDNAFSQTRQTFAQTLDQIKSAALYAFQPLMEFLTDELNRAIDNGLVQAFEQAFTNIAKGVMIAVELMSRAVNWIADNWSWLKHAIVGAIILMITWTLIKAGISIACAYMEMKAWMVANGVTWQTIGSLLTVIGVIAIVVIAVLALVYVFYLWKTGAIDTCQMIISALIIVGLAVAAIGLLIGGWIMVIVGLAIAAVGLIIAYLEYFSGAVYAVVAAIWNIIVGVVNAILQFIWTAFVEPWIGIIEWVLNVFNGGFNSFGDAVKNLLGNIISWFLSLGSVVTKIIDAIFGTNWTDGLNSLRDNVLEWGKNENAITLTREAPTVQSLTGGAVDRWAYSDAWNTGLEHGGIAKDWVNNLGSQFQSADGFSGSSLLDGLGKNLGLDFSGMGDFPTTGVGTDYSPLLKDIEGNTGSMADSMKLTQEDMKLFRRAAEMEWKKEFTIAQIQVDMTNHNTVGEGGDLDGIVTKLADKLYEEMDAIANGVYA